MIHAIALDDEPPALDILHLYCDKLGSISLDKVFSNTDEAYKYLEKFPVDVLFLDINMPSVSGIEFYKMLPHKVLVIFTTSYSEYAVESYNLNAVDYLLKPFSFSRFEQAVKKAEDLSRSQLLNTSELPFLMLRADYSLVKIVLYEILFIEGLDNYLKIHLDSQNPVVIRMTLKALLEKLPSNDFIRVHRSFIIPLNKITVVRNKIITIGTEEIPLGSSYEETFMARFKK